MPSSDDVLTMFTAEVQSRDGTPLITVPDRELAIGELEVGETYRVAVLPRHGAGSDGAGGSGTASSSRSRDGAPPVEEGETLDVEIEDVGDQGDGIARIGPGYIVFVPDTDVGDRVTIEVTDAQENFAFAEVVEHEPISD